MRFENIEFNPRPPSKVKEKQVAVDGSDFEYLKLTNPSETKSVDLTGAQFTDGIRFSFDCSPITKLALGESLYVVRNRKAFFERHGFDCEHLIAGEYGPTRLENRGERICLEDGLGKVVLEQEYEGER